MFQTDLMNSPTLKKCALGSSFDTKRKSTVKRQSADSRVFFSHEPVVKTAEKNGHKRNIVSTLKMNKEKMS